MLYAIFVFAGKSGLDHDFIKAGFFSDWGVFSSEGNKNVCSKHEGWVIPPDKFFSFLSMNLRQAF